MLLTDYKIEHRHRHRRHRHHHRRRRGYCHYHPVFFTPGKMINLRFFRSMVLLDDKLFNCHLNCIR